MAADAVRGRAARRGPDAPDARRRRRRLAGVRRPHGDPARCGDDAPPVRDAALRAHALRDARLCRVRRPAARETASALGVARRRRRRAGGVGGGRRVPPRDRRARPARLRGGRHAGPTPSRRVRVRVPDRRGAAGRLQHLGVRVADDAQLHQRPQRSFGVGPADARRRQLDGLLRRRASRSPCGAFAAVLGEGTARRHASVHRRPIRPSCPLALGAARGGGWSAPPFPCSSSPTTRRTTSPSAARAPAPASSYRPCRSSRSRSRPRSHVAF